MHRLRTVRLADDTVTVRELLTHTGGVDNPAELYADAVPDLAELDGPGDRLRRPARDRLAEQRRVLRARPAGRRRHRDAVRRGGHPPGPRPAGHARLAVPGPGRRHRPAGRGRHRLHGRPGTAPSSRSRPRSTRSRPSPGSGPPGPTWCAWAPGGRRCCPRRWPGRRVTPQAEPGPAGIRIGLGLLLDGGTATHGGSGFEAVALLRSRVRDHRTFVVLTSRAVSVESLDDSLRRAWLRRLIPPAREEGHHVPALPGQRDPAAASPAPARARVGADRRHGHVRGRRRQPARHRRRDPHGRRHQDRDREAPRP